MTIACVRCAARGWYCSRVPGVQSSEKSQTSARIRAWSAQLSRLTSPRREAALVRHDLVQGDVAFAARGEFRQVVADLVHERQPAFLDQRPHRRAGQHLGLAEQQEQRVVGRRRAAAFGPGVAIGAEQRELAVARQRDLRAGIAALFDMLADQPVEMFERLQRRSRALRGCSTAADIVRAWASPPISGRTVSPRASRRNPIRTIRGRYPNLIQVSSCLLWNRWRSVDPGIAAKRAAVAWSVAPWNLIVQTKRRQVPASSQRSTSAKSRAG